MDSTLGIFTTGYPYFLKKFRKQDSDIYKTRVLLKKAIVMKGEEAAEVFYDTSKFKRKDAAPKRLRKTLFGEGGVQGLDEERHKQRKALFMRFMNPASINELEKHFNKHWLKALKKWEQEKIVILFDESKTILFKAACEWTGVPLREEEAEERAKQMGLLIESPGALGIKHYRGLKAREEAEAWIAGMVEEIRANRLQLRKDCALYAYSMFKDTDGELLPARVVGVEILNLLRPILAISRYIVFSAHALHNYPGYRQKLKDSDGELYRPFVQEVRRFYPFFSFVAARVKKKFKWKDVKFPKNRLVLLDLYATNHDKQIWEDAGEFIPKRFFEWKESPFSFIPQGGGNHYSNHRCAGEWVTIQLTRSALVFLVEKMNYKVPRQDLNIKLSNLPALPKSGFKIKNVRSIGA